MEKTNSVELKENQKYIMDDKVIEEYTKYPLDDYYVEYYDTLASGKKYRGFSWKAFFFRYYWASFRVMNPSVIFWMLCLTFLMMYSLYGILGMEYTKVFLEDKKILGDVIALKINIFPFSKVMLGAFLSFCVIGMLFIGCAGDFLYAKYGVLYNKSKWAQKDKSYQSYSPWSVFGVKVISEISFWCLFVIASYRNGDNVKFVIWSMFLISIVGLIYFAYDYVCADPKKLLDEIGSRKDYEYAVTVKSEDYFKKQFRKYESGKSVDFNWCALLVSIQYFASKGLYRITLATILGMFVCFSCPEYVRLAIYGGYVFYGWFAACFAAGILIFFFFFCRNFNAFYYREIKTLNEYHNKIETFNEKGARLNNKARIIFAAILWFLAL